MSLQRVQSSYPCTRNWAIHKMASHLLLLLGSILWILIFFISLGVGVSHGKIIKWLEKKIMFLFIKKPFCFQYNIRCLLVSLGCIFIPVEDLILQSVREIWISFPSPFPSHQKGQKPGIPKHLLDFKWHGTLELLFETEIKCSAVYVCVCVSVCVHTLPQIALDSTHLPINARDIRDVGSIPGSGRSPGGGHVNPLQYSCLGNPMDRGTWRATIHGITKSQTQLKWLSTHAYSLQTIPPREGIQALEFCKTL